MDQAYKSLLRTSTTPIPVLRSTRRHNLRVGTSLPAGKMVPIAAIPLLREDQVHSSMFRFEFEMMETAEILWNAIMVNMKAYFVSSLCFERFKGMDDLNRSYEGVPYEEGDSVVPFIETATTASDYEPEDNEILFYMGKHLRPSQAYNTAYIEAYNVIWNLRARNRSHDINLRPRLKSDELAPAFWQHEQFSHIVPDFDQAVIDGEVALNVPTGQRLPVSGIGIRDGESASAAGAFVRQTGSQTGYPSATRMWNSTTDNVMFKASTDVDANSSDTVKLEIFAEMQDLGITVSLSNLDLAKKTQAFAKLREQYTGHTDEYIVDLLMKGISVPEQAWKQPILLADKTTSFGMAKRYASDGGNLTESVVNGVTGLDLTLALPKQNPGGVIMIVCEITPEQLFERQQDVYLHTTNVSQLPDYLRDFLDPEKVEVVKNDYVDNSHGTPAGNFGYAPLNHRWANPSGANIGGKFHRPTADATEDEYRQRIWAVETANPTLSEDFYLCTAMHDKPFAVRDQDQFECFGRGDALITGNTVFGGRLVEPPADESNFDAVLEKVDQTRIQKF